MQCLAWCWIHGCANAQHMLSFCVYWHAIFVIMYCFMLVLYGATFCVPNTVPEAAVLLAREWKGCQALIGLHPDSNMVFFTAIVLIFKPHF